jgi:queuine tRNA-ribosyltransferase
MNGFRFTITHTLHGTLARAGIINTPHGRLETPAFIAGGTKATVKALTPEQVIEAGGQAVLANTYHLMLQPGAEIVQAAGGLGKFMHWSGPTFTDSGGFQAFSLGMAYKKGIDKVAHSTKGDPEAARTNHSQLAKVDEDGVSFRSHLDGSTQRLTPELSMQLQWQIGADIHMAFDEALAPLADDAYIRQSLDRTHVWARRSKIEHERLWAEHDAAGQPYQALYGVVQGARSEALRRESAQYMAELSFDGFGIGGVYEPGDIPTAMRSCNEMLPEDKPRHLLGMGAQPADLFLGVEYGVDSFDCVAPTRQARNGALYTPDGRINIRNQQYARDFSPVSIGCGCYTCLNFTRAYLNHLFKADEMLGATLASIHNEHFVIQTVRAIRQSIIDGSFLALKERCLRQYYRDEARSFL